MFSHFEALGVDTDNVAAFASLFTRSKTGDGVPETVMHEGA
jgi:hypothetical protein